MKSVSLWGKTMRWVPRYPILRQTATANIGQPINFTCDKRATKHGGQRYDSSPKWNRTQHGPSFYTPQKIEMKVNWDD